MLNVLFVCLGNICRSPMAEGIFRNLVENRGLSQAISCDSAGTSNYHIGELPHQNTRKVAFSYGITLTHKARQFSTSDFKNFEYILAMDKQNLRDITDMERKIVKSSAQLALMCSFDVARKNEDVPDPYYGTIENYEEVYQLLEETCSKFFELLRTNHNL